RRISRRAASRSDSIKLITPTVAAVYDRRAWGVAQSSAVIGRRYSINIAPLALNRYGLAETLDNWLVNWLEKIIAAKGDEILAAKKRAGEFRVLAEQRRDFRDFAAAIQRSDRVRIIAETKKASPSAGVIEPN